MAERLLMSMSAYARHRGCTHQAVSKAAKAGRISVINGKIDPVVADIQWAKNTNVDQQQRGAPQQFEITQQRAEAAVQGIELPNVVNAPDDAPPEPDAADRSPALVEAKRRTEELRQRHLELDLATKSGELVRLSDVERAYAAKLVAAREALDSIPDRVISELLTLDYGRAHARLAEEIRLAMSRLIGEAPASVN